MALAPFANSNSLAQGYTNVFIFRFTPPGIYTTIVLTTLWVGSIIGALALGYALGPLFLFVHKNTIGRKMEYAITKVDDPTPDKFKGALKSLFPALMALNFAIMIGTNDSVKEIFMNPTAYNDPVYLLILVELFLSFMGFIAIGLFSPVWMLLDSGIVYSNEKQLKKKQIPMEARSVGGWFLYLMKGYAGISVIFTFYELISDLIASGQSEIIGILFFGAFPFLIMLLMLPAMIVLDIAQEHRTKYILKYANKFGITDQVVISFQK